MASPQLAATKDEHWVDWSITHAMANTGLDADEVERWSEPAKQFWRDCFFTSEYCRDDEAIAGARDYLAAIVDAGAVRRLLHRPPRADAGGHRRELRAPRLPGTRSRPCSCS